MKNLEGNARKRVGIVLMAIYLTLTMTAVCFAAPNYGEAATKLVLDNLFWIIILVGVILSVVAFMKHATTSLISIVIICGILAYFCKNPELVASVGEGIAQEIFGGA